ncbi:MAG: Holliday junction resolvase RuvX [Firmicutes bacterium]|nr:Holliday junction resolvase RuvX [Bacillota bacterium]
MSYNILALDPGTDKLGIAVLTDSKEVLFRAVVARSQLTERFGELVGKYNPNVVVLGSGTGSESFKEELKRRKLVPEDCKIVLVDEYRTSEAARRQYLAEHRSGWRKLIPLGLQTPPEPYDDYVAVILGQRYLDSINGS